MRGIGLERVIAVTGGITAIYLLGILTRCPLEVLLGLYASCLLANGWMVLRILKDPYDPHKRFETYFYEDRPDLKRNPESVLGPGAD